MAVAGSLADATGGAITASGASQVCTIYVTGSLPAGDAGVVPADAPSLCGAGTIATPQLEQNRLLARFAKPQFGQVCDMTLSSLYQVRRMLMTISRGTETLEGIIREYTTATG